MGHSRSLTKLINEYIVQNYVDYCGYHLINMNS